MYAPEVSGTQAATTTKVDFDWIHFRYKTMPKVIYFSVQAIFVIPLVWLNAEYLTETQEGIVFAICFVAVTLLTFVSYLRTALADPGYISSLMFNKAYANNETEIS